MAISIISRPDALHPAYNDVVYTFDSTNKSEPNFKYIVDIYDVATVPTLLKRYRINPEPVNQYCDTNLSQFLQAQVDFDLTQQYVNGATTATDSQFPYTLRIGEEYETIWTYDFVSSFNDTGNTFDGYVALGSTSTLHSYSIGDYITIRQSDGGILYPALESTFVIVATPNTQTIVINLLYNLLSNVSPLSPVISGDTTEVGVTSTFANLLTITGNCASNQTYKIEDFINYDFSAYTTSAAGNSKFLTNQPSDNYFMHDTQEAYTMFSFYSSSGNSIVSKVRYENDGGDIIDSASISVNQALTLKPWLRLAQTGPGNNNATSAFSGTTPLVKTDTKYYDFWLVDSSNNQITEKKRVYISKNCRINETEILFLDRLGSWSSFAFDLKQFEDVKVSKQNYNKTLDYSTNLPIFQPWLYGGDVTYNSTVQRNYKINTNWMTEEMSNYFEELVSSPVTLMRFSSTDDYFPVNVLTDSIENESFKNTKLIKKSLVVKSAWGEKVNI
jgi:hypothetical protein